jgi:iron complex outermembrane recepter protein
LALAAILATAAITASYAQDATQPANDSSGEKEEVVELNKFVATGSRFNDRTVTQSLVPIDVVSGDEIRNAPSEETPQILQRLVPSVNFPRTSISDGTDSARPATLRGLAPDQLLVLVNGKRQHQSALINVNGTVGRGSGMVDLNAIPTSIIGRVEVLRDGASAQYGSDAIAGVINLVLRQEIRNELQATWGETAEGDGRLYNLSAYGGFKLGDVGKVSITAYYRDREGTDRSLLDTRQQYFGINPVTGLPVAISGNYGSGTGLSAAGGNLDPRESTINRQTHRQGDSATKDKGLFLDGDWALGSNGATFYAFGGYNKRDVTSYGFFRRAGQDTNVRAIYPDGYLPTFINEATDASFGGGFKGKAAGWNYDASLVWGKNDFDFNLRNTVNVSLGAASPTRFYAGSLGLEQWSGNLDLDRNYDVGLTNPLKVALGGEWRDENYTIDAGEPDSYRDGGVRIIDGPAAGGIAGVGAQVFPGFRPSDATDASRHSYAAYLDMENQVTGAFTLSGAVRFEDYSDFGNTTTFKVAGRYDLPAGFGIRASASSGFRAPGLGQQFFTSTATNFITVGGVLTPVDIRTVPVNTAAAKALGATPLSPEKSRNYTAGITYNNPGNSFSASIDFYRIYVDDRIVLSSTFSDPAIAQFFENQGLAGIGGARFFTNAVDTRTEGVDLSARYVWKLDGWGRLTFTGGYNINTTRIVGSRYGLNSNRTVTAANPLLANYTGTPLFDLAERVRMEKGQPDQTVQLGAQWNFKKLDVHVGAQRFGEVQVAQATGAGWDVNRINYLVPGYTVQVAPAYGTVARGTGSTPGALAPAVDSLGRPNGQVIQTFEAKWIADFEIGYEVLEGLKISVGMQNAFDTYPETNILSKVPVTGAVADGANNGQGADNIGIFPYNPNGGAPWGINGRFSYIKATYRF